MKLLRLARIARIALKYGLDEFLLAAPIVRRLPVRGWRHRAYTLPRGARLRQALEELGPIFVKFGQLLSTRRDLVPPDLADELALLQDHVPPFDGDAAVRVIETALGSPISRLYAEFDRTPVASASVAQVHFARLPDGKPVAVKVLRPGIGKVIANDLGLMQSLAWLVEKSSADGRRLRPREVVAEFEKHLADELDLMREAANCSQLRRNFRDSPLLLVPEVYWDGCARDVMTMDRMEGIPVSQTARLAQSGVNIPRLAEIGVEIFFTQVFRDGFFHADMHPGNILVVPGQERYIALDFGIMGTLTETDKQYLARNFLAFFRRDYKGVAIAHLESGWVPPGTRADELEAAVRAVCEPVFDRPLKEISFGRVLLQLFQASRRFNVEIQPQLVLLQKTLLNIEGLGRQLDPDLDLWKTAKPYLERWMSEQVGWRALFNALRDEAPKWAQTLPQLPRLAHQALTHDPTAALVHTLDRLERRERQRNRWLAVLTVLTAALFATTLYFHLR